MELCSEVYPMETRPVREKVRRLLCRVRIWIEAVRERREESAARQQLASLSAHLKEDLGIGHDGNPLDRKGSVKLR